MSKFVELLSDNPAPVVLTNPIRFRKTSNPSDAVLNVFALKPFDLIINTMAQINRNVKAKYVFRNITKGNKDITKLLFVLDTTSESLGRSNPPLINNATKSGVVK
jgi:hypothetical protein